MGIKGIKPKIFDTLSVEESIPQHHLIPYLMDFNRMIIYMFSDETREMIFFITVEKIMPSMVFCAPELVPGCTGDPPQHHYFLEFITARGVEIGAEKLRGPAELALVAGSRRGKIAVF